MRTTKSIETYLVGGAVRDSLLGLSSADKDWVVVGSNSTEMIKLGFQQVGKDFPVFLHPSTHEEYALARQERKSSSGHTGFQVHTHSVSLEEDLSRRDLTINAIAQKEDGTIIDPHGGVPDIDKRVLRHVSNAFREDPLRVLRIARFAAQLAKFDFKVAPETLALLKSMSSSEELSTLSAERIWKETEKALRSDRPRIYFEVLRSAGALKVLFPEIEALFGVPQRPKFHPEIDAGLHTLLSLDRITEQSNDPRLRFAVLTHDIGKATTPKDLLPDHSGHEERSAELTEVLCQRLKTPNAYRKLAVIVARHHLACHRALRLSSSKIEELLSVLDAWGDNPRVSDFTQCCMADARGRTGLESRIYPQVEFLGECTKAARNTSAKALISQGYSGADLGKQLKISRANLIEPIIAKYAHIDELKYAKKESNTA